MFEKMLREIDEDMREAKWESKEAPDGLDAKAYKGTSSRWEFVVVDFSIEDQGFPKGSRGYDGVARLGEVILHLPREVAEAAFRFAEGRAS